MTSSPMQTVSMQCLACEGHVVERKDRQASVLNDGSHLRLGCLRSWRRIFGEVSKSSVAV